MIPIKCPTCGLQWMIREDSPASVTCPRCLAAIPNRQATLVRPPPLPVLPLEREVRLDTRTSAAGIVVLIFVAVVGLVMLFALGASRSVSGDLMLLILAIGIVAAIGIVIM